MSQTYLAALKLLARRELSEAQVRQRLARRGHDPDAIEEAVARLKEERAIDDARVAEAIARTETSVKRRGIVRVRRQIENAGPITGIDGLEQRARTRELDVVTMGGDSQDVDRHEGNKA